jgi:two-component system phosphate regulon sensor histidine kinase PhoR
VEKALISGVPVDEEAVLHGRDGDVFLRVFATRLEGEADARPGAVAVLSDITRLRRLENVRREFVANVSHELRTPVTSILGFVETLRGGALDDPEKARRFLDIVARHSERLAAIIDDLLLLARLESGEAVLERSSCAAIALLEGARQALQAKADERGVYIRVDADPALMLNVNPSLVQQAVANLVDNAVKYSPAQSEVVLTAGRAEDGRPVMRVTDHGAGIPAGHLPRLFERFYRVDKQRSREQGGTGLGLAIVKHIMQTHGGEVDVESRLGEGSTFTLIFPSF